LGCVTVSCHIGLIASPAVFIHISTLVWSR